MFIAHIDYNHPLSIPGKSHTEPETEPSQAQRQTCRIHIVYTEDGGISIASSTTFIIIWFLFCCFLWATLEQKLVKRVAYVKFQLIYTFAPVYLFFLILQTLMFIELKWPSIGL